MQFPISVDNNATTPVDPLVLESMIPFFTKISETLRATAMFLGGRQRRQ